MKYEVSRFEKAFSQSTRPSKHQFNEVLDVEFPFFAFFKKIPGDGFPAKSGQDNPYLQLITLL